MMRRARIIMWMVACWFAARARGVDLNRAIYVGSDAARLRWVGKRISGVSLFGASESFRFDGALVETVFDALAKGKNDE